VTIGEKKRKATKEILISMTNIINAMKEAEENLASNDLAAFCENLKRVEQISRNLHQEIELKYGTSAP
jgi:hypothetical protein